MQPSDLRWEIFARKMMKLCCAMCRLRCGSALFLAIAFSEMVTEVAGAGRLVRMGHMDHVRSTALLAERSHDGRLFGQRHVLDRSMGLTGETRLNTGSAVFQVTFEVISGSPIQLCFPLTFKYSTEYT
jgi:hypothetical protein